VWRVVLFAATGIFGLWRHDGELVFLSILSFAVIEFLAWAFKAQPPSGERIAACGLSKEELDLRFDVTYWKVGIATFACGVAFALASYWGLWGLNRLLARMDGPAYFTIFPWWGTWAFFAGFGGMILPIELVCMLWTAFGNGEEMALYLEWADLDRGYNLRKLLRRAAVTLVLPIFVLTVLALPIHDRLLEDKIQVRDYAFTQPYGYRYADARRMTEVHGHRDNDGNLTQDPDIVIDFADGRRWRSGDAPFADPKLAEFLRRKIKLPMQSAATEDDIPRSVK
jgi:hypothetical protein